MPVGEIVYISDEAENVGRVSTAGRAYFSDSYNRLKNHSPINVSSASGGSGFESAPVGKMYIRSESGNAIMWVGGSSDDAPYSGHGFPLFGGETTPVLYVNDFASTRVCSSVSGQVVYAIGFLNGEDVTLPNTTPSYPDVTAPYIVSHSPVSGLSGVSFDTEVSVTFNEALYSGSVISGALTINPVHTDISIYRDITDTSKAVLRPNTDFSGETTYTVTLVSGAVTDVAGNAATSGIIFSFTTTDAPPPPDTTAPNVSGISPVSGTQDFPISQNITVTFSEQMLSGTINPVNIFISTTSGASAGNISGTVSLNPADDKTVTVDPTNSLDEGVTYYVNITNGCQDQASAPASGNALDPEIRNHAFSTNYNFIELYNVNSTSSYNAVGSSDDRASGLKLSNTSSDLYNEAPKRIVMTLSRGSTPTTGTATLKIYNHNEELVSDFGSFDTSVLTTSAVEITITNLSNTTILSASGYYVLLFYSGPGYIKVFRASSDIVGGVRFSEVSSSGIFSDTSSYDVSWRVYK